METCKHGLPSASECYVCGLEAENERLRAALERMDDRKNPMLPRSVMARIAKEALDYTDEKVRPGAVDSDYLRGHEIRRVDGVWTYADTGEPTVIGGDYTPRTCGSCGGAQTSEGHDACLANLPGVINACCGHGAQDGYVMFEDGRIIRGKFNIEEAVDDGTTQESAA